MEMVFTMTTAPPAGLFLDDESSLSYKVQPSLIPCRGKRHSWHDDL